MFRANSVRRTPPVFPALNTDKIRCSVIIFLPFVSIANDELNVYHVCAPFTEKNGLDCALPARKASAVNA